MSSNPAVEAARPASRAVRASPPFRFREWLERPSVFSWLLVTPPLLFLIAFLGYPFCYGVYLTFVSRPIAQPATFVGLGNFEKLWNDPIFWKAVRNTIEFTGIATVIKLAGGLGMALVLHQMVLGAHPCDAFGHSPEAFQKAKDSWVLDPQNFETLPEKLALATPILALTPAVRGLLRNGVSRDRARRPTAGEWREALVDALLGDLAVAPCCGQSLLVAPCPIPGQRCELGNRRRNFVPPAQVRLSPQL